MKSRKLCSRRRRRRRLRRIRRFLTPVRSRTFSRSRGREIYSLRACGELNEKEFVNIQIFQIKILKF